MANPTNSSSSDGGCKSIQMYTTHKKHINYDNGCINLVSQSLTDEEIKSFALFMHIPISIDKQRVSKLTSLYLDDNKIFCGFVYLFNVLKNLTFITVISLNNNNLGDIGAKALASCLHSLTNLKEIDISNNQIGLEGGKAIAKALEGNQSIHTLTMENNNLGTEGANAFGEMVSSSTIEDLVLSMNNIELFRCLDLAEGINKSKTLLFLNMSENFTTPNDEELIILEKILMLILLSKSITNIFLQECGINNINAQYIANALKINNSITHLFLADNSIGNVGAGLIFDALENNINTVIKYIDLSHNYDLDNSSVSKVVKLLNNNDMLQELDMSNTDINKVDGLIELGKGIKSNKSILSILLFNDEEDEEDEDEEDEFTLLLKCNKNIFWYPYIHKFNLFNESMYKIIITVYLCNSYGNLQVRLPNNVIINLFKYFKRSSFINT